ncbi:MAG: hypothetical protein H5T80_08755 [Dietzia sp.]|nr:hypothetical protein [Dietzia sp.]
MKRALAVATATFAAIALAAAPAGAADRGPTIDQLEAAGWFCFDVPGLGIHCAPQGGAMSGKGKAQNVLYFNPVTHTFAGAETLLLTTRDMSSTPCAGHSDGVWHNIGFAWACHHPAGGR